MINAMKYSREYTKIFVSVEKKEATVNITVTDQGFGIPKEKLPHIFDRFFQAHENKGNGFGLGLYISNEIIKKHNGTIYVTSHVGKGSTFCVSLPYKNL